jgi:PAS domain S-box-containing protein
MKGKLLIVEDDHLAAKDLQYQVERLGCEVVGISESAEEAMSLAEIYVPDLALMDINIVGSMDGIQTARLLQCAYQIPVVFLTTHNDEATISRAALEMPFGYLTKPVAREDLKATLLLALHRVEAEAFDRAEQRELAVTMDAMQEGLLTISLDGTIQFMNAAAEKLTGVLPMQVRGRQLSEVVRLRAGLKDTEINLLFCDGNSRVEEFGWALKGAKRDMLLVDMSFGQLLSNDGEVSGYLLTLRNAAERLRAQTITVPPDTEAGFDSASTGMVQLDADGRVMRVNDALLRESHVKVGCLVGRSLTDLSLDPDRRISEGLVPKLLGIGAAEATVRS